MKSLDHTDAAGLARRDLNPGRGPLGRELVEEGSTFTNEELLDELMREFRMDFDRELSGPDTRRTTQRIFAWFEEHGQPVVRPSGGGFTAAQHTAALVKILEYIYRHPTPIAAYCLCKAFNLGVLNDVIEHRSMAQFARERNVTKEAVRKQLQQVQEHFNLEKLPEQRSEESCRVMSDRRLKQLKQK